MKGAEMLYAMECYGDLPTRTGILNRVIQQVIKSGDFSPENVDYFLEQVGIYDISYQEAEYIHTRLEIYQKT